MHSSSHSQCCTTHTQKGCFCTLGTRTTRLVGTVKYTQGCIVVLTTTPSVGIVDTSIDL
jgi:hypothetical protein